MRFWGKTRNESARLAAACAMQSAAHGSVDALHMGLICNAEKERQDYGQA